MSRRHRWKLHGNYSGRSHSIQRYGITFYSVDQEEACCQLNQGTQAYLKGSGDMFIILYLLKVMACQNS